MPFQSSQTPPRVGTAEARPSPAIPDRLLPRVVGSQTAAAAKAAPTIRYVRKTGSNSNGGTSPSDAWLTIGKALTTVASNTIVYVGAGVYRETVLVTITPTQEVAVIGDVDGSKTGDPGIVQWTAYTTNDKTAPSVTALLDLNGKSNLTFRNLFLVSAFVDGGCVTAGATSSNITFTDCSFLWAKSGSIRLILATAAYGVALNWTIDRCQFYSGHNNFIALFTAIRGGSADYDLNCAIRNSMFVSNSGGAIAVTSSGAGAGLGGGVRIMNCFSFSQMLNTTAGVSTSIPCSITNSVIYAGTPVVGIFANTAGQVNEDYNLIVANTPRTNVTVGPHSVSDGSYAPLFHFGQEMQAGMFLRPFGEPMSGSPLLNFGNDGNQTTYDAFSRPRPTGSATALPAVGALERSNVFVKQTGTTHTGANAISATGPAYQDFLIPVDTTATTVSVYARYDVTYAGPRPKIKLLANPEIGVSELEAVMQGPSGAWEQLTLAPFTATGNGVATVRVLSNDTNGAGTTYFDTFAVA